MALVTPQMVKELREMTLAGMADCKKALDEAAGDIEKAVIILREKGLAAAAKKASRAASEGIVSACVVSNTKGFVVEVNCETDFVTRNEAYQEFVASLMALITAKQPKDLDALLALDFGNGHSVKETATGLVAKIGENISVRRFEALGNGKNFVSSYVHGGGKIGVLVELGGTGIENHLGNGALNELAKDVALQAAAMKPQYLNSEAVPVSVVDAEREVLRNKYLLQGKPEAALAKIIPSGIQTWFKDICLVEQPFVKEDGKNVTTYVAEGGKKIGIPDLKVVNFVRLELGQGVEKKAEDFAAEVAAQVAAASK